MSIDFHIHSQRYGEKDAERSPWERLLQQAESAAMHDRSRAPATALCNGISESTLASAAAVE
jgi:hypothetical protein